MTLFSSQGYITKIITKTTYATTLILSLISGNASDSDKKWYSMCQTSFIHLFVYLESIGSVEISYSIKYTSSRSSKYNSNSNKL